MIKRVLFFCFFAISLCFIVGAVQKPVLAATYGVVTVPLTNPGTIPITVTVNFYHNGTSGAPGTGSVFSVKQPTLAVGESRTIVSDMDNSDAVFYSISWSTSCSDPPAIATFAGTWGDSTQSVNQYNASSQDVHCTTPNATPNITNTACANVGWSLTGVGVDGANISGFWVYMSQNSGDLTGPSIGPYDSSLGSGSRSYDFGSGGKSGTYYVRVRAVSPQGVGSWSSIGSFNCGAAITAASNLNTSASCNGSGAGNIVAVNFTWTPSSGGSTAQYLDYSVFNNNFGPGTYSSVNVGTGASSYNFSSGFPQGITFYWRINNQISGNWYPSVTANFFTPSCPVGTTPTPTPAPTATPGPVCPGGCTAPANISDSWSQPTGYAEGTDSNFNASNCSSGGTSCTTPLNSFTGGSGVIYAVHMGSTSGASRIKNGAGTTAGGPCYCSTNGRATFTWSWSYTYEWCEVTALTDTSCYANPTVQSISTASLSASFAPKPNTYYHREVWAPVVPGDPGYSIWNQTSKSGSCNCPTPTPSPTPPPAPTITLSGYSDCVDGVNPLVHLTWTSNTGNTGYTVFRDGGSQGSLGNVRSWNSSGAQPSGSHSWLVQGTGGAFGTINSSAISIVTATCSPPPADPSNLIITSACDASGNPVITFRWKNNSTNETGFWMDVSHDAFTSPSSTTVSPSVWGVKGISTTVPAGTVVQFLWNNAPTTNTAGMLDSGDVDSAVAGSQLAPERGVTYYWRVKAYSADRQSNHVYPNSLDGTRDTTVPPGTSFTTLTCKFDLSVENNPIGGNVQVYDPGATANLKVRVYNTTQGHTLQEMVSFTGGAGTIGFWPTSATLPNCTTTPQTPPTSQTITSTLAPGTDTTAGSFQDFTFTFTVSNVPGSYIASFYALPSCTPNNDLNWTNNGFQLTYAVSAKAWFQTAGADVGARGTIQVSNTSVPLYSQSSYVLAGNPLDSSVNGKWELSNYSKPLFPSDNSGVYNYFNSRFRSKASVTGCTIGVAAVQQCMGDMSVGATNMATAGNWIIFVDGNLTVTGNITVGASTTLVFIVSNNVTINTNVTQADGVYVAGGTFADYDNAAGKARNTAPYQLVINGAVYAHAFDLSSFLSNLPACVAALPTNCDNSVTPADKVNFQPKYLVVLSQLIGSPAVSWQEVAP